MRLLRQLTRCKLRTTLTNLGITIGIWALVVFSSMANKINSLVAGGSQYFAGYQPPRTGVSAYWLVRLR